MIHYIRIFLEVLACFFGRHDWGKAIFRFDILTPSLERRYCSVCGDMQVRVSRADPWVYNDR